MPASLSTATARLALRLRKLLAIAGYGPWRRAFRRTGVAPAIEHAGPDR